MQNQRRVTADTIIDDDGPQLSEAELGIDQPDSHDQTIAMAAMLNHPDMARLIDAAVNQRLAAMGHGVSQTAGQEAVVAGIEKLINMTASQQPGYSRPLPSEEVERRADGFIEMNALIAECKQSGTKPRYRLVNEPLFAGEIEYRPGSEIETLLYPNEHMQPMNEQARLVHLAMMKWIGGPQLGIGERVAMAEAERAGRLTPESGPFVAAGLPDQSPVAIVADPPEERGFDPRKPPQAAHQVAPVYQV